MRRSSRLSRPLGLALAAVLTGGSLAATTDPAPTSSVDERQQAVNVPDSADWYETFITAEDGTTLHVDVMRPAGLADDVKTPVILVASPYLAPYEGALDTSARNGAAPGPSDRFHDFFVGADVWNRGYTVVMVSLRGTNGSDGCLDILGPGEQMDVTAGVEWAASQPWSTGKVGMYGKSYDANTGAAALAVQPEGLAAVVAQAIAPDRYDGSYSNRVRLAQSLLYPSATYGARAELGWSTQEDPLIIANSVSRGVDCQALLAEHYVEDGSIDFWRVRDFVDRADETTIPTIITAGYLDTATNIGAGAIHLFETLEGPKQLWVGWWDHVRGNDTVGDELAMGREGWFDTVMRFFDHHVKGLPLDQAPTHLDPVVAAQSSDGFWRTESEFPPADAVDRVVPILPGAYEDDGTNNGSRDSGAGAGGLVSAFGNTYGNGSWTFSEPVDVTTQVAGIPSVTVDVSTVAPRTNLVVNVYDVSPGGKATMITRGASLVDASGEHDITLFPTDWVLEEGHRFGVLVSGANVEAWIHTPTNTTVTVNGGEVRLPVLPALRAADLPGEPAPRLLGYLSSAPIDVDTGQFADRTS